MPTSSFRVFHVESYSIERILGLPIGAGPTIEDTIKEDAWARLDKTVGDHPKGTVCELVIGRDYVDVTFVAPAINRKRASARAHCICGQAMVVFSDPEAVEMALADFWSVHKGEGHGEA